MYVIHILVEIGTAVQVQIIGESCFSLDSVLLRVARLRTHNGRCNGLSFPKTDFSVHAL